MRTPSRDVCKGIPISNPPLLQVSGLITPPPGRVRIKVNCFQREKASLIGLGFGMGLGYDSGDLLGFGPEIRAEEQ